jgi:hypothetical protein
VRMNGRGDAMCWPAPSELVDDPPPEFVQPWGGADSSSAMGARDMVPPGALRIYGRGWSLLYSLETPLECTPIHTSSATVWEIAFKPKS